MIYFWIVSKEALHISLMNIFKKLITVHTKGMWQRGILIRLINPSSVALGGLVVSVLATGPKVCGRGRWIIRVIKSTARLPSERKYSRRSHVIDLRHFKEPYKHDRCLSAKFSGHVSHLRFTCFATKCLLALLTDVPSVVVVSGG
jgi:hypothetical protein